MKRYRFNGSKLCRHRRLDGQDRLCLDCGAIRMETTWPWITDWVKFHQSHLHPDWWKRPHPTDVGRTMADKDTDDWYRVQEAAIFAGRIEYEKRHGLQPDWYTTVAAG